MPLDDLRRSIRSFLNRIGGEKIFFYLLIGFALFLVFVPLGMLLWSSFRTGRPGVPGGFYTLQNFITAYSHPKSYEAMINSFLYAGGGTLICLMISLFMAWSVERTNMPFRNVAYALLLVPLAMPGMLFSISWILLLSPDIGFVNVMLRKLLGLVGVHLTTGPFTIYSLSGMIFLDGLRHVPTIFLMVGAAFRSMDPALEEAAFVSGCSTMGTLRQVTIPILIPAIFVAGIYSFMTGIESFEIPGIIGLPADIYVFSTRIYWAANVKTPPDFGLANSFSVTFLVISTVLLTLYQRATRHAERFSTVTGKGYRARVIDLGKFKYVPMAIFALYFIAVIILPFFILAWASLLPYFQVPSTAALKTISFANYVKLWNYPGLAFSLKNTIILMLTLATVTMTFSFLISWIAVRSDIKGAGALNIITFMPHCVPGVVIGLSTLLLYLGPLSFIPIFGTIAILVVAMGTRYMAFGTRTANSALIQIHKELEEAAYVSGLSRFNTFAKIVFPLILPAFINGWVWVAVHGMREMSQALMLYSENNAVISTKLWMMWADGEVGETAVLGVFLIGALTVITALGRYAATKFSRQS